ncbi:MAG: 4Fe-4S binding protein [Roseburia sp.]|nr:4Fe-4S binding protein [Roseburia sp.]
MPAILNLKRCDNVKECGVPSKCSVGAFYWDETKKSLVIDAEKCIDCGLCENACPSGAILVVPDMDEYNATLRIIEQDKSTVADLFVDRYGAMTVSSTNEIRYEELDALIKNSTDIIAIEVVDANNPSCLISAVPYSVLFENKNIKLYKIMTCDDDLSNVKEFLKIEIDPALVICKNGKVVAIHQGEVKSDNDIQVQTLKEFIKSNC